MHTNVEFVTELNDADRESLARATNQVIASGSGIGWVHPLDSTHMNTYWQAVLMEVQKSDTHLCIARFNSLVVGSVQLHTSSDPENDAASHAARITKMFVAPEARRMGLARRMLQAVELRAKALDIETLELDVCASQTAAIKLYESQGFKRWGVQPFYAKIAGQYFDGFYYLKQITG